MFGWTRDRAEKNAKSGVLFSILKTVLIVNDHQVSQNGTRSSEFVSLYDVIITYMWAFYSVGSFFFLLKVFDLDYEKCLLSLVRRK